MGPMTDALPPGWYRDPAEPETQRWWDGEQWRGRGAAVGPLSESTPDAFAVVSLVTALLLIPVVPIWFGFRAQRRIRESGGTRDGNGIALIGIGLGLVELVGLLVAAAVVLVAA